MPVLLEREDKLRREMECKLEQMREALTPEPPKEAVSEEQVTALQARLEALHSARLLSDGERDTIEDTIADYLELKAALGRVTLENAHASEGASRLLKLVGLSEGIAADGAFARQARRK